MKNNLTKYQLIGGRIRNARELLGWSQKKLAKAIGFESGTAISLIESGERRIAVEELEKISNILHRDIKYFIGQDDRSDFRAALRADKKLTPSDQDKIFDFYQFVIKKKKE